MSLLIAPGHLLPSAPQLSRSDWPSVSSPVTPLPFAIYIHWPYCEAKCPYCDFNSHARRTIGEDRYLTACLQELRYYHGLTAGREVRSIFFGGGTPSLMSAATVGALLDEIGKLWPVSPDCEITLEANPSSVEASRFAGYRAAGVNRVSVGVQALDDASLKFLGRLHTAAEARAALEVAARHFERLSFDLIYARPEQSMQNWRSELTVALAMAKGHLSLYQLTIEPETAFFELHRRGKLQIPEDNLAANLYDVTQDVCEAASLPAYEVSNHAATGQESRHNLIYWEYGDYIGIGPGAHGRITVDNVKIATAAIKTPAIWAEQVAVAGHGLNEKVDLTARDRAEEMTLMGLRLHTGLCLSRLERETGFRFDGNEVEILAAAGLINDGTLSRVAVTRAGRLVLNAVANRLASSLIEANSVQSQIF